MRHFYENGTIGNTQKEVIPLILLITNKKDYKIYMKSTSHQKKKSLQKNIQKIISEVKYFILNEL